MLSINENRQITGNITIDNQVLVNMVVSVSDNGGYTSMSTSILNEDGFKANVDACEAGILEFTEMALLRIREVLKIEKPEVE